MESSSEEFQSSKLATIPRKPLPTGPSGKLTGGLNKVVHDLAAIERAWRDNYWGWALDHACDEYGGCAFKQICTSAEPESWLPMYF